MLLLGASPLEKRFPWLLQFGIEPARGCELRCVCTQHMLVTRAGCHVSWPHRDAPTGVSHALAETREEIYWKLPFGNKAGAENPVGSKGFAYLATKQAGAGASIAEALSAILRDRTLP